MLSRDRYRQKKTLNDNSILKIYIVGVERWLSN